MILLTVYREPGIRQERKEFSSLRDAINFGQGSGYGYDVYDPDSGRVIDWDEINFREEEEWYYDETELLWKKIRHADGPEGRPALKAKRTDLFSQNLTFAASCIMH